MDEVFTVETIRAAIAKLGAPVGWSVVPDPTPPECDWMDEEVARRADYRVRGQRLPWRERILRDVEYSNADPRADGFEIRYWLSSTKGRVLPLP